MPTKEELKRRACRVIDRRRDELIGIARDILEHPETGFNEYRTANIVKDKFQAMGVPYSDGLAITGVKGQVDFGAGPGPRLAIIGELDSLVVTEHPNADSDTGAAHACGHNCQIGMMLGATLGLLDDEIKPHLSGSLAPFAVPAEEFIDVEGRLRMREEGKLEFLGGKQELIRIGAFDDVQMAMMCHTASDMGEQSFSVGGTSNGHMVKYVQYIGRAAHAGGAPHLGINALNAATWALNAIHANRETVRENETGRFHGIVTKGGEAVNAVPADVRLEWRVRSSNPEAVVKNNAMVDRCFKAGALAVGAKVQITNIPGYLPMRHDPMMQGLFQNNASELLGPERVAVIPGRRNRGGSTDMGDLSHVIPVCHPYAGGATGPGHSKGYIIADYEKAVINPAKIMAMVAIDLLAEDAAQAHGVLDQAKPPMDPKRYVSYQRQRAEIIDFDGAADA